MAENNGHMKHGGLNLETYVAMTNTSSAMLTNLFDGTKFITTFVEKQDKKSFPEQPVCMFIRLDVLQVHRLSQ